MQGKGKSKILWISRNEPGNTLPGMKTSAVSFAKWLDRGSLWAFFTLEEGRYVDVSKYIEFAPVF